jgi:hypothetical protein
VYRDVLFSHTVPTEMSASPFLVFFSFFLTMQRYEVIIVKISENGKEKTSSFGLGYDRWFHCFTSFYLGSLHSTRLFSSYILRNAPSACLRDTKVSFTMTSDTHVVNV